MLTVAEAVGSSDRSFNADFKRGRWRSRRHWNPHRAPGGATPSEAAEALRWNGSVVVLAKVFDGGRQRRRRGLNSGGGHFGSNLEYGWKVTRWGFCNNLVFSCNNNLFDSTRGRNSRVPSFFVHVGCVILATSKKHQTCVLSVLVWEKMENYKLFAKI